MASVVSFGAAALWDSTEQTARKAVENAMAHGINYVDVAPSYGRAEGLLGPLVPSFRDEVFLACKTLKREKTGAQDELRASLRKLQTDHFDLYQVHGINTSEDVDKTLGKGGAIEAFLEAKDEGTIKHIGVTGHSLTALTEALRRFDFDTVMFPLNFVMGAHPCAETDTTAILGLAKEKDVGVLAIKAVARRRWETDERKYRTWYEPLDGQGDVDLALWYTLSHPVTTAVLPSDLCLWPKVIDAAERLRAPTEEELSYLKHKARELKPLFPTVIG